MGSLLSSRLGESFSTWGFLGGFGFPQFVVGDRGTICQRFLKTTVTVTARSLLFLDGPSPWSQDGMNLNRLFAWLQENPLKGTYWAEI